MTKVRKNKECDPKDHYAWYFTKFELSDSVENASYLLRRGIITFMNGWIVFLSRKKKMTTLKIVLYGINVNVGYHQLYVEPHPT